MSIKWTDVVSFDEALKDIDSEAQTSILNHVNDALKVSEFGGEGSATLRLARIYLAAHHGTIANRGGSKAGPVTSQSVGPISRSYSAPASVSNSLYGSTTWGQAYLQLVRNSPARMPIV